MADMQQIFKKYKKFNKPYDGYKKGISNNIIKFGLKKYCNLLDDIKTDCVDEFTQLLNKRLTPTTLNCEHQ